MKITFDELDKMDYSSVTDYCRFLIEEDAEYYGNLSLEVYRGEMLCLTVRSIEEGSKIMPTGTHWIKYDKSKRKASLQA